MTWEMILGFIRHVLTFGGGWLVAKGWLDEGTMNELVGAVMTVLGVVMSMWQKGFRFRDVFSKDV
jgi:hypothetical protein